MYEIKILDGQIQMNLDEDNLVYQSNNLINANYDMTALEQKILLINISIINKKDTDFGLNVFRIKDLADLLQCSPELLYRDLPKLSKKIISKVVEVYNSEKDELEQFNIIHYAKYKNKKGIVEFEINPRAKPYLLQLESFFSSFELKNALRLVGKYSIRLYQITKASLYKREMYIPLEEFKNTLKLTQKSYDRFNNISNKILIPSVKEINKCTDIELSYETVLSGRKAIGIKFKMKDKHCVIKPKEISNGRKQQKNNQSKRKDNSFFNFQEREYDYDYLEKVLVGEEEYDGRPYSKY